MNRRLSGLTLALLAIALGLASSLGAGIALGLQLLGTGLQCLALFFQRVDSSHVQGIAPCSQASSGLFDIGAQVFGI